MMNRFAKKQFNRSRVYPGTNTVDTYGEEDLFIRIMENTIERGDPVVTAHRKRDKTEASAYPPPTPLRKEKNRLCKLRVRHLNHCMAMNFKYAFTLTVPSSSTLRYDGSELLHVAYGFLLQNPAQKIVIQLEVYPKSKKANQCITFTVCQLTQSIYILGLK